MAGILSSLVDRAEAPAGTYVGANVANFNEQHRELMKDLAGIGGSKVTGKKLHTTVIYSRAYVDPALVEPLLTTYKLPLKGVITGAAAFDALPAADGSRDDEVSTLVLKFDSPELMELHAACKDAGCTHTYPELSPHVSLYYGAPKAECHAAVDRLNASIAKLAEPLHVELTKLFVEPIKENWAAKNTKKD